MQASQRADSNHALEYAVRQANSLKQPAMVLFGLTDRFPEANARHYTFMLEGLKEVQDTLKKRGIQVVVQCRSPEKAVVDTSKEASLVVTDCGYLRIQRAWRNTVARQAGCPVVQVESDVIVPVRTAYGKEAYTAGILRPHIHKRLRQYLAPLKETKVKKDSLDMRFDTVALKDIPALVRSLNIDQAVHPVRGFHGGTNAARFHLETFIKDKLRYYHDLRSDPSRDLGSNMSPYLHFGHISPLTIALHIQKASHAPKESIDAYLEELIVRRELSMNFCYYNHRYDTLACLPDWAAKTLREHGKDKREYLYSSRQWEEANTHDPCWNAAQREMVITGKMHNYMRMYWGKKILEWTKTPEKAYQVALMLNNKYELDGRDPNGFAGVAWCFGKHDRAWKERPVFGKVRYMNAAGLNRKFDMDRYIARIKSLEKKPPPSNTAT
jgi:deoxyribodipyrimidine photo-lyase